MADEDSPTADSAATLCCELDRSRSVASPSALTVEFRSSRFDA
jgi:hypothetical protein